MTACAVFVKEQWIAAQPKIVADGAAALKN
jgi:hypothetical protein